MLSPFTASLNASLVLFTSSRLHSRPVFRLADPTPSSSQIMDLENRNATLLEELSSTTPLSRRSASLTDWLPRAPARHSLSGHRSPITKVAFHPLYSVLSTASEDASVKIWDWESGELERTVKGHTKAVMDVEYDKKGETMGQYESLFGIGDSRAKRKLTSALLV
jgi:hypothetical protein